MSCGIIVDFRMYVCCAEIHQKRADPMSTQQEENALTQHTTGRCSLRVFTREKHTVRVNETTVRE